jgi:hypothetical protein
MDIQPMTRKILLVTNPMIRKSLLPNFPPADLHADGMRISALNELHHTFERYIGSRREEQMNVVGHQDESMKLEFSLAPVAV